MTAPPPLTWRDPARARGHRRCPWGCRPAAGDPLPGGAVPPKVTPSPQRGPAQPCCEARCSKDRRRRRDPAGQGCALRCKSGPIASTERGLPIAGRRYLAGPSHGKLNLHPSLQRGAHYAHVSLLTCLLCMFVIVESEGNGTRRWEALPGKPEGPQPSGKVGTTWERCSGGLG